MIRGICPKNRIIFLPPDAVAQKATVPIGFESRGVWNCEKIFTSKPTETFKNFRVSTHSHYDMSVEHLFCSTARRSSGVLLEQTKSHLTMHLENQN